MKLIFFIASLVVASQAVLFSELILEEWTTFKLIHHKKYNDTEEEIRFKIYMTNREKIAKHNKKYELGLVSYKMALNKFSDITYYEFKNLFIGNKKSAHLLSTNKKHCTIKATFIEPANVQVPKSIDWRKHGAVTPVKDQGNCASCWAFSVTGSLEGQHFRKTGELISLSEQNLLDCSRSYGNIGCGGGSLNATFEYISDNHGIDTEKSYPYESKEGKCRYNPKNSGAISVGYVDLPRGDEEKLKIAVATIGPISIELDTSHQSIIFYSDGVYYEPKCSSKNLNHAALVVGYGTNDKGQDYWIVKNSIGEHWGKKGYLLLARNKNNHCGIATHASYPLV